MEKSKETAWKMDMDLSNKGEFKRHVAQFRNWIKADGSTHFKPERGRYHLYVSLACPWAHRTLIMRKLKGLEDVISVNVVHHYMTEKGWYFDENTPGSTADDIHGKKFIREIYLSVDPEYTGRFTVPVLYDKINRTIVSNESSEIIRMFNSEFNAFCASPEQAALDFYPDDLRNQIDDLNTWIYDSINNGVYKSGFAQTQEAYNEAVVKVFDGLDRVETILAEKRYLTGKRLTEADIRLYTTLIRFDPVYVGHFKCAIRRIVDYKHIWAYLRELYQMEAFASTTNFDHIKKHYYESHVSINPTQIVPVGPHLNYQEPHGRDNM